METPKLSTSSLGYMISDLLRNPLEHVSEGKIYKCSDGKTIGVVAVEGNGLKVWVE